jgi:hypothetical protein
MLLTWQVDGKWCRTVLSFDVTSAFFFTDPKSSQRGVVLVIQMPGKKRFWNAVLVCVFLRKNFWNSIWCILSEKYAWILHIRGVDPLGSV